MQSYAIRGLSNPLLILCSEHINGGNLKVGGKKEGGGGEVRPELRRKRFRRKTFLLSKTPNINTDEINSRRVTFMIIAYLWACLLSSHQSPLGHLLQRRSPINQYSRLHRLRNDSPHDVTQSIFSARLCFAFWTCTDSDCVCSKMPKQRWPTLSTGPEGILWWHWHRSPDPSRCKRLNQSSEVAFNYLKCLLVKKKTATGWEI